MTDTMKHNPKLWERKDEQGSYWLIWCPACGCGHSIPTPRWSFNNNLDSPTFTPSVRLSHRNPDTKQQDITHCHFNITNGQIVYHGDCPHGMAGKTIPMQEIPSDYGF